MRPPYLNQIDCRKKTQETQKDQEEGRARRAALTYKRCPNSIRNSKRRWLLNESCSCAFLNEEIAGRQNRQSIERLFIKPPKSSRSKVNKTSAQASAPNSTGRSFAGPNTLGRSKVVHRT